MCVSAYRSDGPDALLHHRVGFCVRLLPPPREARNEGVHHPAAQSDEGEDRAHDQSQLPPAGKGYDEAAHESGHEADVLAHLGEEAGESNRGGGGKKRGGKVGMEFGVEALSCFVDFSWRQLLSYSVDFQVETTWCQRCGGSRAKSLMPD